MFCDHKQRSGADLDEILKQHKLWLASAKKAGARADLSCADLFLVRAIFFAFLLRS